MRDTAQRKQQCGVSRVAHSVCYLQPQWLGGRNEVTDYVADWGEGERPSPINNGQAANSSRGWLIRQTSRVKSVSRGEPQACFNKVRLAAGVCFADEGARRGEM